MRVLLFFYPDIDECTASSPLCDVNAQCSNTRGSHSCRCKLGFSGSLKILPRFKVFSFVEMIFDANNKYTCNDIL